MSTLFVGARVNTTDWIDRLKEPYLLIDDGVLSDIVKPKGATRLDLKRDSLNPLQGMEYPRDVQFVELIETLFPGGGTTLRREKAQYELLVALQGTPRSLEHLIEESKDEGRELARIRIATLMLSPVLKPFLTKPGTINTTRTIVARLDRQAIGARDALAIAHVLISRFEGQVVIADFGFYGRSFISYLVGQDRLLCGVRTLAELSNELRQSVLLCEEKIGNRCTAEDAEVLANYLTKFPKHSMEFNGLVSDLIS